MKYTDLCYLVHKRLQIYHKRQPEKPNVTIILGHEEMCELMDTLPIYSVRMMNTPSEPTTLNGWFIVPVSENSRMQILVTPPEGFYARGHVEKDAPQKS